MGSKTYKILTGLLAFLEQEFPSHPVCGEDGFCAYIADGLTACTSEEMHECRRRLRRKEQFAEIGKALGEVE